MERQSYSNYIKNKYGNNVFKDITSYQNSSKQIEILNEDIHFLSKCKRAGIIPIHCRIGKRRSASPNTKKIIQTTEKKLLNRSLVKNYSKRWKIEQKKLQHESRVDEILTIADYMKLKQIEKARKYIKI